MPAKKTHSVSVYLKQDYPSIVKSAGIYLYDDTGKQYIDASSGPVLCSLGYGNEKIATVLKEQTLKTSYVFRMDFAVPESVKKPTVSWTGCLWYPEDRRRPSPPLN